MGSFVLSSRTSWEVNWTILREGYGSRRRG